MLDQIRRKKDSHEELDRIFKTLENIKAGTLQLLANKNISLEESRLLCEHIARLRAVLADWENAEAGLDRDVQLKSTIRIMKMSFQELEGMMKEARNDLIKNE